MYRLSGQSRLQRKNECVIMQWLPLLMWRRLTFGEIVSESRFWHMVLDFMKEVLKMSTVITVLILVVVIGFAVRSMWKKRKTGGACGCGCSHSCSCHGCAQNKESASVCQNVSQQSNR